MPMYCFSYSIGLTRHLNPYIYVCIYVHIMFRRAHSRPSLSPFASKPMIMTKRCVVYGNVYLYIFTYIYFSLILYLCL